MATQAVEFPHTEVILRHSSDAVFVFFCAYLMVRYTVFLTTSELPTIPLGNALDVAGIAFGTAALISFAGVARRISTPNLVANFVTVILTATLTGAGTLSGLIGHSTFSAGTVCGILAAASATHVIGGFAGLIGGIVGCIAAGKLIGGTHLTSGITAGVVAGIFVTVAAVLIAFFIGTCIAFSLVTLTGEDNPRFPVDFFIGLPTCIGSGIAAGFAVWFCDDLALELIHGLKDVPEGFVGGVICGIAIGFVFGVNLGFTTCYEQIRPARNQIRRAY